MSDIDIEKERLALFVATVKAYDPSKHPRNPKGSPAAGKWRDTGRSVSEAMDQRELENALSRSFRNLHPEVLALFYEEKPKDVSVEEMAEVAVGMTLDHFRDMSLSDLMNDLDYTEDSFFRTMKKPNGIPALARKMGQFMINSYKDGPL